MFLSGLAAYLCNVPKVVLGESGQGSLGDWIMPVGETNPDCRNNPEFTNLLQKLIKALLNYEVAFDHRNIWSTKGEILKHFFESYPDDNEWRNTRSCWRNQRLTAIDNKRRQCGICSNCILRRMSVYVAGKVEAPDTYVWEDLTACSFCDGASPKFDKHRYLKSLCNSTAEVIWDLDHLAKFPSQPNNARPIKRAAYSLSCALDIDQNSAEQKLMDFLLKHQEDWNLFINYLGNKSFITKFLK